MYVDVNIIKSVHCHFGWHVLPAFRFVRKRKKALEYLIPVRTEHVVEFVKMPSYPPQSCFVTQQFNFLEAEPSQAKPDHSGLPVSLLDALRDLPTPVL